MSSSAGISLPKVVVYNGTPTYGNGLGADIFDVDDFVIPTAALTNVFTIPVAITEDFVVWTYGRVITANTNTTITLAWNDESGPQSATLHSGGWAVGGYPLTPQYIHVVSGSTITLNVTPATGNRVFISTD